MSKNSVRWTVVNAESLLSLLDQGFRHDGITAHVGSVVPGQGNQFFLQGLTTALEHDDFAESLGASTPEAVAVTNFIAISQLNIVTLAGYLHPGTA